MGGFEVGWNTEMSPTDKDFIGVMYPKQQGPGMIKLTVGGPAVQETIGKHGEEDLFEFQIATLGVTRSRRQAVRMSSWDCLGRMI